MIICIVFQRQNLFDNLVITCFARASKNILEPGIYPDHKFPQIITLHEDWNDGYNVSVRLKWRIWCFPKATIPLLSFFWNFFLKEFICIPAQILEPGIYPARELYFFKICDLGIYTRLENMPMKIVKPFCRNIWK